MSSSLLIRIAAIVMVIGISLGAFGAHGLEDRLNKLDNVAEWNTASLYHMFHGIALLGLAALTALGKVKPTLPAIFWLLGVLLFSGSLYAYSYTNISKLGIITPFGGTAFLIGWFFLIFHRVPKK